MRSSLSQMIAAAALSVCAATVAIAAEPTTASDNSGNGMATSGAATGGGSDAYRGYQSDYPASEVQAVPGARADAVRARMEMDLARVKMSRFIDRSWGDFYSSKEYVDAEAGEKRAQLAYDRERDRVIRDLAKDPSYQALTRLVKDLRERIEREHPKEQKLSQAATDQLVATASVKMGYSSTASAMEAAALGADSRVQDARARLVEAGSRKTALRREQDRSLRHSPEFAASQEMYDQLKIQKVVSEEYLAGLVDARTIALNYAGYLHGWDKYRWSSAGGLVGYGGYGGYGYPSYNSYPGYGGGGIGVVYGGGGDITGDIELAGRGFNFVV